MTKYLKTAYQFGALGGMLSGISFYVLSLFNPDPTNLNLVFGYVITPFAVYLAIKFYKEYANEGFLSFAEGMTIGAVTYLILALLSILMIWGILASSPSLFEAIQTAKWAVLEQNKEAIIGQVGQESFELTQTNLKGMGPWDIAFNDGIWKILPGMFFSILISLILKKNKA
ncbi:MAG: DUF4199 domain-containing protein [Algoriphagus sp.]|nr:DUF4199 domain-containing protein [Algoriphagus sp.]